jgi:CubicO group peptidase (beta-lactamase class C family)
MKKYSLTLLFGLTLSLAFAQLEKEISTLFAEAKNRPGVIIGVFEDGNIEYQRGFGLANLDYDIPITSRMISPTAYLKYLPVLFFSIRS